MDALYEGLLMIIGHLSLNAVGLPGSRWLLDRYGIAINPGPHYMLSDVVHTMNPGTGSVDRPEKE